MIAAARPVGSFQPPVGSTTIWSAPLAASHWRSGLRGRQLAEAQHQLGHDAARPVLVAQQGVVGGDDVGAVVGAEAHLRGRLGEDREAGGAGEVGEGLAQLGVGLAAGDDHPRDRVADVAGDLVEDELRSARGRPG